MIKVLIIEDESEIRSNIADILTLEGFEAVEAADGLIGLELAQSQSPDLILCDLLMPGLDGFQVLERLSTMPKVSTIPVILVTAMSSRANCLRGLSLGAKAIVSKPFTCASLIQAIEAHLPVFTR